MTVKATDLEVSYQQTLTYTEAEGDSTVWRVPAMLFGGAVNSLPMGGGSTVQIIDNNDNWLYVKAGNFLAKIAMLDPKSFPILEDFDTDGMMPANKFAQKG